MAMPPFPPEPQAVQQPLILSLSKGEGRLAQPPSPPWFDRLTMRVKGIVPADQTDRVMPPSTRMFCPVM